MGSEYPIASFKFMRSIHCCFPVGLKSLDELGEFVYMLTTCYGKELQGFLISSFRRVLYVVCLLLGNFPTSGVYMPTFQNTLFHRHRQVDIYPPMKMEQSVPKRRHINSRRRGITQKKAYNNCKGIVENTAKLFGGQEARICRKILNFYIISLYLIFYL